MTVPTIPQPLYQTTCVSRHLQLKTGGSILLEQSFTACMPLLNYLLPVKRDSEIISSLRTAKRVPFDLCKGNAV